MSNNYVIGGRDSDLAKSPFQLLEDFIKANWTLVFPSVTDIKWKFWDGYGGDYTLKVVPGVTMVDPLNNQWSVYGYRSTALIHLFARNLKGVVPVALQDMIMHVTDIINHNPTAMSQSNGISSVKYVRILPGSDKISSQTSAARQTIFHVVLTAEMTYAKFSVT